MIGRRLDDRIAAAIDAHSPDHRAVRRWLEEAILRKLLRDSGTAGNLTSDAHLAAGGMGEAYRGFAVPPATRSIASKSLSSCSSRTPW